MTVWHDSDLVALNWQLAKEMQEKPLWSANMGHADASAQTVKGWMGLPGSTFGSHGKWQNIEQTKKCPKGL